MTPYDRLAALGLTLPPPPSPIATYVPFVREGDILYLSGQGPKLADGTLRTGKVGAEIGIEQAYDDARLTGLNLLSILHAATGDLSRVRRVIKLLGMVNATPDFAAHPKVINGCSDLLLEVFGERGRHARSAVGFGSLPDNITVEIEAIVAIEA
ncbi:enamine deaminase RidA (YjgF/YER057c/UK114 family) [Aminobacter niigataensis]|uniref:Enamine deaminase RidA (YjgF/YER057c/UK114 family) n=1 Tax=Aminobacter niigataensis TaxID=83265 RepID=A0ABR6KVS9_9HYPH|nr:RidA family protein [Aminobacter niigataensis]MBB4648550.1 enamine deaminase RidA (YjgF/YER057c/UK114 family) [Aminobacter niigataensis]